MRKREKRPKSKARRIIEWVLFGVLLAAFGVAAAGMIDGYVHRDENYGYQLRFGYGNFIVLTDSMEPEYKINSAIITHKDEATAIYDTYINHPQEHIDITFMFLQFPSFVPDDPALTNQTNLASRSEYYGTPMTHRVREIHVDESVPVGKGRYIFVVAGINTESERFTPDQYQAFDETYLLGRVVLNSDFLGGVFSFVSSPWGLFTLLLIPAFYLVIASVIDIFRVIKDPEPSPSSSGGGDPIEGLSEKDKERLKAELLEQMLADKAAEKAAKEKEKKEDDVDAG